MAYQDFLDLFARLHGIPSRQALLEEHGERYRFQIASRERACELVTLMQQELDYDFTGKRVLDVGCAYGSFAIELARRGAHAVGVDVVEKWLYLAEVNAWRDADCVFLKLDASSRKARLELAGHGPFDFIILNDVLEHIHDTDALLGNLSSLLAEDGIIYYKVPNGWATRNVLSEGHKKIFGISLLPPDCWGAFTALPFYIYYRRWGVYEALFQRHGLSRHMALDTNHDQDIEQTRRHIRNDLQRIREAWQTLDLTFEQRSLLLEPLQRYHEEVEDDLEHLDWASLHHKYRLTFWKGVWSCRK